MGTFGEQHRGSSASVINVARVVAFTLHATGPHPTLEEAARAVVGASWLPDALALVPPRAVPGSVWPWMAGWLACAAAGVVLAWRRRLREPLALLLLSIVGLPVVTLSVSHIVGTLEVYLLWWVPLPLMALIAGWAVLLFGEGGLLGRRAVIAATVAAALALAVTAGTGVSAATATAEPTRADVGEATQLILAQLHQSGPVVLDLPDPSLTGIANGVAAALIDQGRAVVVPGLASRYETRASRRPPSATVRLAVAGSAADVGGVPLGVVPDQPEISVRLLR